jgi:uncharacterized protein (UPF0261 family)
MMAEALTAYLLGREDVGGVLALGGSSGAGIVSGALQALAIGTPRVLVSPAVMGDIDPYIGASDTLAVNPITDLDSMNSLAWAVIANAAHALAGMIRFRSTAVAGTPRPRVGFTMIGLTTAGVAPAAAELGDDFECLTFPGLTGPVRTLNRLARSGEIAVIADCSPNDVARLVIIGDTPGAQRRLADLAASGRPYVGSAGSLDFAIFRLADPTREPAAADRTTHQHSANIQLVRTSVTDAAELGRIFGAALSAWTAPVRFIVPMGGFSAQSEPGGPLSDPDADRAFTDALVDTFVPGPQGKLVILDAPQRSAEYADAVVRSVREVAGQSAPGGIAPSRRAQKEKSNGTHDR